ncbi:hypothetical protein JGU71_01800 [Antrihabitans sp. YC3-6]|uniref:GerMN domain-containing protein n=1 Tax=Antrihabitans stalagmiti TaxID=2799499 RepID=A0A934NLW0_9NOCA|nr:hypothetical protein [Antrihabitans stalagmiti]MBJ8337609.1 hypothetical protein [Antrihabitans stalagmiti]
MSWLRHTAVALAGVASVGFTGAAASVVLSDMGVDMPTKSIFDFAMPNTPRPSGPVAVSGVNGVDAARTVAVDLATATEVAHLLLDTATQESVTAPNLVTPHKPALEAKVTVDDYYLGAAVSPVRSRVVGLDFTTNILDVIPTFVRAFYDPDPNSKGPTEIRTELDGRVGEVNVVVSDPDVGEREVTLTRTDAV